MLTVTRRHAAARLAAMGSRAPARLLCAAATVIRESASEPVVAAERLLKRALAEKTQRTSAGPIQPITMRLSAAKAPPGGVQIVLETPADVDAARVLREALIESLQWRLDADGVAATKRNGTWQSGEFVTSLHSTVESASLRLHIPHVLERVSTPETPMLARPRLQPGALTFEAPSLSVRMARALANAAQSAASERDDPDERTGGGPLRELDKILEPLPRPPVDTGEEGEPKAGALAPPLPTAVPAAHKPPPFFNEAALRASAANAATFPEIRLPGKRGGAPANAPNVASGGGSAAGGSAGAGATRAMDREYVPASAKEAMELITELGARVVPPSGGAALTDGWAALAGGESVARSVDEALLMPLRHPAAFRAVLRATRASALPPPVRPTALMFYGPPGTGKTAAARIAAEMADLPLVSAPLESLISKWFGEGEQRLAALFARCEQLGPCVLFLDELDALAGARGRGEMHEATRRMLSVLLRHLDGFDAVEHVALIAATNRPEDLDPALASRFDVRVHFPPPDADARARIFGRYAKQLGEEELASLAAQSGALSGRDILDVCKQAERRWVYSRLSEARGSHGARTAVGTADREDAPPLPPLPPPPLAYYEESVAERCAAVEFGHVPASADRPSGGAAQEGAPTSSSSRKARGKRRARPRREGGSAREPPRHQSVALGLAVGGDESER